MPEEYFARAGGAARVIAEEDGLRSACDAIEGFGRPPVQLEQKLG